VRASGADERARAESCIGELIANPILIVDVVGILDWRRQRSIYKVVGIPAAVLVGCVRLGDGGRCAGAPARLVRRGERARSTCTVSREAAFAGLRRTYLRRAVGTLALLPEVLGCLLVVSGF